jgi:hypothetical protein
VIGPWTDVLVSTGVLAAILSIIGWLGRELVASKNQQIDYWKERALSVEKRVDEAYQRTMIQSDELTRELIATRAKAAEVEAKLAVFQRTAEERTKAADAGQPTGSGS